MLWNCRIMIRLKLKKISVFVSLSSSHHTRFLVFVFEQLQTPDYGHVWQDPEFMNVVASKYAITRRVLGSGAFAEVRLGVCNRSKRQVAVKILFKSKLPPMPAIPDTQENKENGESLLPDTLDELEYSLFNDGDGAASMPAADKQRGLQGGIIPMSLNSQQARLYGSNELDILCRLDHVFILLSYSQLTMTTSRILSEFTI